MKLLLDTCAISELSRSKGSQKVKDYVCECLDENLFLSVITIGEINKGIHLLDDFERRKSLFSWLHSIQQLHGERILPISDETAEIWGQLTAAEQKQGRVLGAPDGLIAATAIEHGLTIATRNISDFETLGVMLINPWIDA